MAARGGVGSVYRSVHWEQIMARARRASVVANRAPKHRRAPQPNGRLASRLGPGLVAGKNAIGVEPLGVGPGPCVSLD